MTNKINKHILLLIATVWASQLHAGNVTVPNTFVDGTTASAGEVNANFTAVESAVNDNGTNITTNVSDIGTNTNDIQINTTNIGINASEISTNSTNIGINAGDISTNVIDIQSNTTNVSALLSKQSVGVYSGNVRLGTFLGASSLNETIIGNITMLTNTGYFAFLLAAGGLNDLAIYYEEAACVGQAYVFINAHDEIMANTGFLLNNFTTDKVFYVEPKTVVEPTMPLLSTFDGLGCRAVSGTHDLLVKAFPNNPNITGVVASDLRGSIRLGL